MSFRKTLSLITIFVMSTFVLMLSSSYAWYSFSNASTSFDALTNNEDIRVMYKSDRFISTVTAVPISDDSISSLAEKNIFSIDVDNEELEEAVSVSVSLTSIEIDSALKNENFKYELLYNGNTVAKGNFSGVSSDKMTLVDGLILNNLEANSFELRVYLLDDGSNQNNLMNKTFKAIISVNVISRVNVTLDNQDIDFLVKSIIVDGKQSNFIPYSGRYTMNAVCDNGSKVTWDSLSKSLKVTGGSIKDRCSLEFYSSKDYDDLSSLVKVGSYVKYAGNNGCSGSSCEGVNVNFVDDTNMGYCSSFGNKYVNSGYRVLYVEDNTVFVVSAGALECTSAGSVSELNDLALKYCNSKFVYNNTCDSNSVRTISDSDFKKVLARDLGSCNGVFSDRSCGYGNDLIDDGGYYWYGSDGNLFNWNPSSRSISSSRDVNYMGLRVVIRLNSNVKVVSGNGTYDDPYVLIVI